MSTEYKKVKFSSLRNGDKFFAFPYENDCPAVERIKIPVTNNAFVIDLGTPDNYTGVFRDDEIVYVKKETSDE